MLALLISSPAKNDDAKPKPNIPLSQPIPGLKAFLDISPDLIFLPTNQIFFDS